MNKYMNALRGLVFSVDAKECDYNLIKELVDKEIEFESRREKLIVGSEWVCVADCYHFNGLITNGEIFTLKRVNKMRVTISSLDCETYVMYEQFLLCFKPKENV